MLSTSSGLIAVLVLVMINGFFVAAEFALVTIRLTRVDQLVTERRPGARSLKDATVHLDSYIAACQLGITMASLGLGWVGEPALAGLVEPLTGRIGGHALGVAFSFIVITILHVVAGELAPKGVALQYVEKVAIFVAGPLRVFRTVFRPAIWLLNEGGWIAARLIGVRREVTEHPQIGAEELRLVVQASGQAGAIETSEQFLLEHVLRFGDVVVASVMVPRTEVVALSIDTSIRDALDVVREHHFSRYPVFDENLDHIVGVLHVRDLLLAPLDATLESEGLLKQPLQIPSHVGLNRLLAEMRKQRTHFAIAVDEFGGTDGIVTFEDVIESIVGETADEFEEIEVETPLRTAGAIRIDGMEPLDTLAEKLGVELEPAQYLTAAGLVLELIGRIPEVGESIEVGAYRLTVTEMDELRIASIEATPLHRLPPDPHVDSALTR